METPPTIFDAADATTPGYYSASQSALLLLDFHSKFVNNAGGPHGPAALKVAANLRTWAKSQGMPVIHCLIDLHKPTFPTCKDRARASSVIDAMRAEGGEEPADLLEDYGNDVTFTRRVGHISALKSPGLQEYLQEKGIKSLFLTGLSTSRCVTWTMAAAIDAEYVVTIVSDGVADSKPEVHDMVLRVIAARGYVATAAGIQEGYEKARSGK